MCSARERAGGLETEEPEEIGVAAGRSAAGQVPTARKRRPRMGVVKGSKTCFRPLAHHLRMLLSRDRRDTRQFGPDLEKSLQDRFRSVPLHRFSSCCTYVCTFQRVLCAPNFTAVRIVFESFCLASRWSLECRIIDICT